MPAETVTPSIVIVMGPSGAGKTTVGRHLAAALGSVFLDADDLHAAASRRKLHRGVPLNDADRAPWLRRLRQQIDGFLSRNQAAVIACSALRAKYRQQLRPDPARVRFVYLKGSYALLRERLRQREGHFLAPELLDSQVALLEEPTDAIHVDARLPVAQIVRQVCRALRLEPARAG